MSRGLSPTLFIIGGETQMAEKNNATCSICGRGYHVCLSCRDSVQLAPWKIHTDTAEHYKVYQVIRGYSTGVYNKDEFKNKLKSINLEDVDSFRPHIKQIIKDALKEEIVVDDILTEEKPVVKASNSRKRSYKVETE